VDTTKLRTDAIMRNFYENFLKSDFLKGKMIFSRSLLQKSLRELNYFRTFFLKE